MRSSSGSKREHRTHRRGRHGRRWRMSANLPAVLPPGTLPETLTLKLIRKHILPLSERTIYRMISMSQFPRADIVIGGKIRLWHVETLRNWIQQRGVNAVA